MKTGKTKTIEKKATYEDFIASDNMYVYYLKYYGYEDLYSELKYAVIRCKPDGSGKKTLVKNITGEVEELTSSSVTWRDDNGKKKTKKF